MPTGTYEWSIAFFEGSISSNKAEKLARLKKTVFGPIDTFMRT